jgi:ATP-dependent DNA ligase
MLARSGPLPTGDYSFELKWDGFRALVARNGDLRVRSRRGWDMTSLLPELADLPVRGVFDGELVAFADGVPHFPLVCERLLHGDRSIPLTFVLFDVLELDGQTVIGLPYGERVGAENSVRVLASRPCGRRCSKFRMHPACERSTVSGGRGAQVKEAAAAI